MRAVLALIVCVAVSGCVSVNLIPKTEAIQLYAFAPFIDDKAQAPVRSVHTVGLGALSFDPASAGDQILTITGTEAAYIGGARWIEPADNAFRDSLETGLEDRLTKAVLVPRLGAAQVDYQLLTSVRAFELRYDKPGKNPHVVITADVSLIRLSDRQMISSGSISAKVAATENRQGAIVAAFQRAGREVVEKTAHLVDQAVGSEK